MTPYHACLSGTTWANIKSSSSISLQPTRYIIWQRFISLLALTCLRLPISRINLRQKVRPSLTKNTGADGPSIKWTSTSVLYTGSLEVISLLKLLSTARNTTSTIKRQEVPMIRIEPLKFKIKRIGLQLRSRGDEHRNDEDGNDQVIEVISRY